jgi:hypothetical protein
LKSEEIEHATKRSYFWLSDLKNTVINSKWGEL